MENDFKAWLEKVNLSVETNADQKGFARHVFTSHMPFNSTQDLSAPLLILLAEETGQAEHWRTLIDPPSLDSWNTVTVDAPVLNLMLSQVMHAPHWADLIRGQNDPFRPDDDLPFPFDD